MSWDDEFDEEYDDALEYEDSDHSPPESGDMPDKDEAGDGFDPMDITNPVNAFFFLSDDAQDAIQGSDKKKMRCLTCGHKFLGEIYDDCPECFSPNTEEISNGIDDEIETDYKQKMKCLSCGHVFQGDITDDCPECYSANTEEIEDGKDDYDMGFD